MPKLQRYHYVKLDECCYKCAEFITVENIPSIGKSCSALYFRLADLTKNSQGVLIKYIGENKVALSTDDILRATGWGSSETVSSISAYLNTLLVGHLLYRNQDGFLAVTGLYFTGDHNEPVLHLSDDPDVQIYPVTVGELMNENTRRSIQYRHDQRMIAEGKQKLIPAPEGMTYAELAGKLGVKKPAVSKLIRKYGYQNNLIHNGPQKIVIPFDIAEKIIGRYQSEASGNGFGNGVAKPLHERCCDIAKDGNGNGNGVALENATSENLITMQESDGNGSGNSIALNRNGSETAWKRSGNSNGNGVAESIEIRDKSKENQKNIYPYEVSPDRFLSEKQNGAPVSESDRMILQTISRYGFSDEVTNVMVEYILNRSQNRLIPSFVQSVCGEWARDHVQTFEDAMKEISKAMRVPKRRQDVLPA